MVVKIEHDILNELDEQGRRLDVSTPSGGLGFFASDVGSGIRKIWFNKMKVPYSDDEPLMGSLILNIGNAYHEMVEQLYKAAGMWLAAEHRIFIDDVQVTGRIDIMVEYEGKAIPVEVKSISPYGFKYIKKEPKKEHVEQLMLYMHHLGAKEGLVHYIDKSNCGQLVWHVEYDEAIYRDVAMRFKEAAYYLEKKEMPPKCDGCTDKNKFPASWGWGGCRWKTKCWG